MGRPQLWDQAIWFTTPFSWGITEGIPCVVPPKFRELLGIMISQVKFAFDIPPLHTHTHTHTHTHMKFSPSHHRISEPSP